MDSWTPGVKSSERETRLLRLVGKSRKLFVFLREHRHEIFDENFRKQWPRETPWVVSSTATRRRTALTPSSGAATMQAARQPLRS
ncbi:hypothetical protein F0U63_27060 [Cystobacter fuscus]|jgi:hypothetical protein|nr:hypothetical protein F0U63_27060 [Cystobacter fuscus]